MRFRKKDEMNFVRVGFFIGALTIVLTVMIISIGKENNFFEPKILIKAIVPNVSNLKEGSYVELKGIRGGTVTGIQILSDTDVEITLKVRKSLLQWIKQDSKVAISNAGLVGDKFLEIFDGTKNSPPFNPENDVLKSETTTDFKQILNKGESIATLTERILNRVDQIFYNLDDGKKIVETVNSLQRVSSNLEKITADLKDARLAPAFKSINTSMSSLERILSRVEHGPGTVNSMIYDDGLHEDLRVLMGGASRNKVIKYFIRESIKNSEKKKVQPN